MLAALALGIPLWLWWRLRREGALWATRARREIVGLLALILLIEVHLFAFSGLPDRTARLVLAAAVIVGLYHARATRAIERAWQGVLPRRSERAADVPVPGDVQAGGPNTALLAMFIRRLPSVTDHEWLAILDGVRSKSGMLRVRETALRRMRSVGREHEREAAAQAARNALTARVLGVESGKGLFSTPTLETAELAAEAAEALAVSDLLDGDDFAALYDPFQCAIPVATQQLPTHKIGSGDV